MQTCNYCQEKGKCLSKIKLFNKLGVDESKNIYLSAVHKDLRRGQSLFFYGDLVDKIIVIRYREIKSSTYDDKGSESISKIYVKGDIIGENSIFLDNSYTSNGVAIENTGICQIDKTILRKIIIKDNDYSLNLIK